jgi:hypothetical protein
MLVDRTFISCAVTVAVLAALARKDAIGLTHPRNLFTLYRAEVERIASKKFDQGQEIPLVATTDLEFI